MWVFLNDKLVSETEARISVFDHGFLYGDGLFETLRAYSGKCFALPLHLERLRASAQRIRLAIPAAEILAQRLDETLQRNQLQEAIVRLTLTRGQAPKGLPSADGSKPTLVITTRPVPNYGAFYSQGASATISAIRRVSGHSGAPCIKSLSFLDNILARQEAARKGVFEAIFLNNQGHLAEGAISNLFWVKAHRILTPSLNTPILNGITRQVLIEEAVKQRIEIDEGAYPLKHLLEADEAFLSNTAFEVMPLTTVDGRKIGLGQPGPMTRHCHKMFRDLVKKNAQ